MPRSTAPPYRDPHRPGALRAWQQRASPLARYALLAYALIVVDASLFPFAGWRDLGFAPYDFLVADWPPRPLPFDLLVNAVGYLPLGFTCVLALHPRVRGALAVVGAALLCTLLSVNLEALQTYLPSRVASKVDVLANLTGGVVGAIVAARVAHALLDTGRLRTWRTRWFAAAASRGLVLTVLWFGAIVYPDAFVLGTGGLLKAFDPAGSDHVAAIVGLADPADPVTAAVRFQLAETAVTGLTMIGSGLLFLNLLRHGLPWARRVVLLAAFALATASVQVAAHAFLFDDPGAWPPLTPGARSGFAIASTLLLLATALPTRSRWALGVAALVGALALVNVYPDNPYGNPVRLAWTRGRLLNFYGLASGLNLVWPYLALGWFVRHRGRDGGDGRRRQRVAARTPAGGPSL